MSLPTVRIAEPGDAPALTELLHEFNGEALPAEALALRMAQAQGLETAFLGEIAGQAVGLVILRTVPTLSAAEDWAEITELYVRPAARRRGVGRSLVEVALGHARGRGCTEVHLLVDAGNLAAQSFYQALGFHCDSCEMRKRI